MIIGMDGGMITARVAEEDVTAAAKGAGYPFFFMAGIRIEPSAATSATAEPEISAKNMEVTILTMESPPLMKPTKAEAKAISRREMPEVFMIAPAMMKSGMARSGKLVAPSNITMATLGKIDRSEVMTMATVPTTAREMAMGTFIMMSTTKPRNMNRMVTGRLPPGLRPSCYPPVPRG